MKKRLKGLAALLLSGAISLTATLPAYATNIEYLGAAYFAGTVKTYQVDGETQIGTFVASASSGGVLDETNTEYLINYDGQNSSSTINSACVDNSELLLGIYNAIRELIPSFDSDTHSYSSDKVKLVRTYDVENLLNSPHQSKSIQEVLEMSEEDFSTFLKNTKDYYYLYLSGYLNDNDVLVHTYVTADSVLQYIKDNANKKIKNNCLEISGLYINAIACTTPSEGSVFSDIPKGINDSNLFTDGVLTGKQLAEKLGITTNAFEDYVISSWRIGSGELGEQLSLADNASSISKSEFDNFLATFYSSELILTCETVDKKFYVNEKWNNDEQLVYTKSDQTAFPGAADSSDIYYLGVNDEVSELQGVGTGYAVWEYIEAKVNADADFFDTNTLNMYKEAAIDSASLTVTAPVKDAAPATTATTTDISYTVKSVEWTPAVTDSKFAASTEYTVKVTLEPAVANGYVYEFDDQTTAKVNGANANITVLDDGKAIATYTFPATATDPWAGVLNGISNGNTSFTVPDGQNTIPKNVFEQIKNSGNDVTIIYPNSNNFQWIIDASSIDLTKVPNGGVDLSITANNADWATIFNNITNGKWKMQITIAHNGEFGFTAILRIDLTDCMEGVTDDTGVYAVLYQVIDNTTKQYMDKVSLVKDPNLNGYIARFTFTHASDYAIIIDRAVSEINATADKTASPVTVTGDSDKVTISDAALNGNTLTFTITPNEDAMVADNLKVKIGGAAATVTKNNNGTFSVSYTYPSSNNGSSGGSTGGSSGGSTGHYNKADDDSNKAKTSKSVGWDNITEEIKSAANGSTITITLNDDTVIPAAALKAAKDKNIKLKINAGFDRTIEINGASIKNTSSPVDLKVSGVNVNIPEEATKGIDCSSCTSVSVNALNFGFDVQMTLPLGKNAAGKNIVFYSYDKATGKLTYVDSAVADANGNVVFTTSTGGSFFIAIDSETPTSLAGDVNGDGIVDINDARLTLRYYFKLEDSIDKVCADVDNDGEVSINDAGLILKYVFKIINAF